MKTSQQFFVAARCQVRFTGHCRSLYLITDHFILLQISLSSVSKQSYENTGQDPFTQWVRGCNKKYCSDLFGNLERASTQQTYLLTSSGDGLFGSFSFQMEPLWYHFYRLKLPTALRVRWHQKTNKTVSRSFSLRPRTKVNKISISWNNKRQRIR